MADEAYKIYSSIDPLVGYAGETIEITVSQSLQLEGTQYLNTTGPGKISLNLQGPQLSLTEDDISGVYPAPGSTDSSDNFVPHIALTRRTLPWERQGPVVTPPADPTHPVPWLALLVLTAADLRLPLPPLQIGVVGAVALDPHLSAVQPAAPAASIARQPAPPPPAAPLARVPAAQTFQANAQAQNAALQGIIANQPTFQRFSSPPLETKLVKVSDLKTADAKTYAQLIKIGQQTASAAGPSIVDGTQITTVVVPNATLKAILPAVGDLELLCHAKEVQDDALTTCSIVVCGRLPNANDATPDVPAPLHMAVLVSLERRDDVYARLSEAGANTLVVLHSWTFTPSKGADFQEVCQAIGYRPNGGVLRFGNLPRAPKDPATVPISGGFDCLTNSHGFFLTPLEHTDAGAITWRGPLRPFAPPPRSNGVALRSDPEELEKQAGTVGADFSHATAFELGKLLALADLGIREDLRDIHMAFNLPQGFVDVPAMPPSLQQRYWGEDMGDPLSQPDLNQALQNPWTFGANQSMLGIQNTIGEGNSLGISTAQAATLANTAIAQLNQAISQMGAPAQGGQLGQIDLGTVTEAGLELQFPEVVNAGSIIGH